MRTLTLLLMTLLGCASARVSSPEAPSYARTTLGGEPDVVFAVDIARLREALAKQRISISYPGALQLLSSASQIDLMMQMRSQAEPWVVAVVHGRFGEAAVPLAWLAEHLGSEQLRRLGPRSVELVTPRARVRVFERSLLFTNADGAPNRLPHAADIRTRIPIDDHCLAVFALGPGFFRWLAQHPDLDRQRPLHRELRRAVGRITATPTPQATIVLEFDSRESAARAELHWRKWLAQSRSLSNWHTEPSVLAAHVTRDGQDLVLELALGSDIWTESPRDALVSEPARPFENASPTPERTPVSQYQSPCPAGLRLDLETRHCVVTP